MRKSEWLLIALVYACVLIAALAGGRAMGWESEGPLMVVAVVVAVQLAAWLYHLRYAEAAPFGLRLLLGVMLGGICAAAGAIAQWRWGVPKFPTVTITLHALGTAVMVVLLFNTFRKSLGRTPPVDAPLPRGVFAAIAAAVVVLAIGFVAWAERTPPLGRGFAARKFPGLVIALPNWPVRTLNTTRYERGEYKLDSPEGYGRSITLRWESGDVPEEILDDVWRDGGMTPGLKEPAIVAGHPASRQYVSSSSKRVFVTTWRCPHDHRWLCLMTFLDRPRDELLEAHESMLASVRCHTDGPRAAPDPLYASFTPPTGWEPAPKEIADVGFIGPNDELVILSVGGVGKHEILDAGHGDDVVRGVVKPILSLKSIDRTHRNTVTDARGHARTVWSCSGADADGATFQVELMAWHCTVRDATFMIWYLTDGPHEAADGTNVLLRAGCH